VSKRRKDVFNGSDTELLAMTKELDELHRDEGMPAMTEGISNMIDSMSSGGRATSRRTFLLGAGAAAGGAAMLVVGGTPAMAGAAMRPVASLNPLRAATFPPSGLSGDLAVAAVAASLENLAVFAYDAGLSAATAGKLGAVPPAVATFATTVKGQHQQHADAWNAVLKSHGKPTVQADFAKVTNITGLAQLAVTLETIAAQTYQAETSMLKSTAAIGLSSSIQPVEMQHIAILYYVLGMYPGAQTPSGTPLAFNPTSQAV
jgi:hypothetical protein